MYRHIALALLCTCSTVLAGAQELSGEKDCKPTLVIGSPPIALEHKGQEFLYVGSTNTEADAYQLRKGWAAINRVSTDTMLPPLPFSIEGLLSGEQFMNHLNVKTGQVVQPQLIGNTEGWSVWVKRMKCTPIHKHTPSQPQNKDDMLPVHFIDQ